MLRIETWNAGQGVRSRNNGAWMVGVLHRKLRTDIGDRAHVVMQGAEESRSVAFTYDENTFLERASACSKLHSVTNPICTSLKFS